MEKRCKESSRHATHSRKAKCMAGSFESAPIMEELGCEVGLHSTVGSDLLTCDRSRFFGLRRIHLRRDGVGAMVV